MKRRRYSTISRYFVSRGFVVFVPTRAGYGESGGTDAEYPGKCPYPIFAPAFAAATDQIIGVLKYTQAKEWFQGFIKAGGNGTFVTLPPYKENGPGAIHN